jgi:hypothetical protein
MIKRLARRRPSAATVIALVALVAAASGTAVAASHLVSGDKLIKKRSLSGNRLRNHTITGTQVNLAKLGKVPSAANADHATNANHATNATNADHATSATTAGNASQLGGQPASAFLSSGSRIGTPGIVKASGTASGNTVTLFTVGPFTVTMTCTKDAGGNVSLSINGSSSEANSVIDGSVEPASTPVDLGTTGGGNPDVGPSTSFAESDNVNIDFEAPSGAHAVFPGASGVNSLGVDCWTNWVGIR